MVNSKKFKLVSDKFENGGRTWVLRRLHENSTEFEDKLVELKRNRAPLSPSEKKRLKESASPEQNK